MIGVDGDLYPTYQENEPGTGLIALPEAEAKWMIEALQRDGTDYEVIPDGDPQAFDAHIALNACESKRTRAYRKAQKLVAMRLPYSQKACDDVMVSFSQYPLAICYPQHLEDTLGLKLREPSDTLNAIANKMNSNEHGTVFGIDRLIGYIGWLLVNKLDIHAELRCELTLDEQIKANTLYLENHRAWKAFSNRESTLWALDVPLNQADCDEMARSLLSVPLLPDAIVCAAYDYHIYRSPIDDTTHAPYPPRLTPIDRDDTDVDDLLAELRGAL